MTELGAASPRSCSFTMCVACCVHVSWCCVLRVACTLCVAIVLYLGFTVGCTADFLSSEGNRHAICIAATLNRTVSEACTRAEVVHKVAHGSPCPATQLAWLLCCAELTARDRQADDARSHAFPPWTSASESSSNPPLSLEWTRWLPELVVGSALPSAAGQSSCLENGFAPEQVRVMHAGRRVPLGHGGSDLAWMLPTVNRGRVASSVGYES